MFFRSSLPLVLLFVLALSSPSRAENVLIAVASNFVEVMKELSEIFEERTCHSVKFAAGSTGKHYAQIKHGAPIDVFLAADQRRPLMLDEQGLIVAGSRFTYAVGRLTLWGVKAKNLNAETLKKQKFNRLAIANPKLAPYGAAAKQALQRLDLWDSMKERIVMGQNAGQTFSMVATGNAEFGLLALSHVKSLRNKAGGKRWDVPVDLYDPIRQDAVLLKRAKNNKAALSFLAFLQSKEALEMINSYGYGTK